MLSSESEHCLLLTTHPLLEKVRSAATEDDVMDKWKQLDMITLTS